MATIKNKDRILDMLDDIEMALNDKIGYVTEAASCILDDDIDGFEFACNNIDMPSYGTYDILDLIETDDEEDDDENQANRFALAELG